jgi:hypothetical protein
MSDARPIRVSERRLPVMTCGLMLLSLTGCVSEAELHQRDQGQCSTYGFQPGTTEFARCMQQENLARQYYLDQPTPTWGPYPYYGTWGAWRPWPY